MPALPRQSSYRYALFCSLALAICVLSSYPVLKMGMHDDWSYIWSARVLADTGHIVYNGWATAMLGWQLYLGALAIKLFGFSFFAVRASVFVISLATAALVQRLFVRFGITEWNATIATLTIVLSPLFLPFPFSFMSDVPGLFSILVCLYACVRALQAGSNRAALGWLTFAALSNVLLGTVRQIVWLGVLLLVPSAAWLMRRRRGALALGGALWCVGLLAVGALVYWFDHQPYAIVEPLLPRWNYQGAILTAFSGTVRVSLEVLLMLLPVLIAFLVRYPVRIRAARHQATGAAILFALVTLALVLRAKPVYWLAPFGGNMVTQRGVVDIPVILGTRPNVLPVIVRGILTAATFAALLAVVLCVWNSVKLATRSPERTGQISGEAILLLLGPFGIVYVLLVITRGSIQDRYTIPLLVVLSVPILRFYQAKIADRLPVASVVLVVVSAIYGVAATHDVFARDRARLAATEELRSANVPRTAIRGGFEYDGWTQIEEHGHVNDRRISIPEDAYHRSAVSSEPEECQYWLSDLEPAIHARYGLSNTPSPCFRESRFSVVPYTTWLAPRHHEIYILRLR